MALRLASATSEAALISTSLTAGNFTVMGWYYPITLTGWRDIFYAQTNGVACAQTYGGVINSANTAGSLTLSVNTWYHIALVNNASAGHYVYVDGVLKVSDTTGYAGSAAWVYLQIGRWGADSDYMDGRIAGVKIYSAILTAADILQEMYTVRPVRTENLFSWHPCFPGATIRVSDWSGGGYALTEVNTLTDEDPPPVSWGGRLRAIIATAATATNLTVADAYVTSQTDAVKLTKSDTLTVADGYVTSQTDAVKLTKSDNLTVADGSVTSQVDALTLTQAIALTVADTSVTSQVDAVALTKSDTLALADTFVTSQTDAVTLTKSDTLTVADTFSTSQTDAVTLTKSDTLALADAFVTSQVDALDLSKASNLTVADAFVTSQVDTTALTKSDTIAAADAFVTSQTDAVTLTKSDTLAVADAYVTSQTDAIVLTKSDTLTLADAFVTSQTDNVTLDQITAGDIVPADTYSTTQADNAFLTQNIHVRPASDTYVGTWTTDTGGTTNLYQSVDESITPNDTDYIQSELSPSNSPVVIALGSVDDPYSPSNHYLRYRYALDGSGTINLVVQLRQGYTNEGAPGTLIAEWTHNGIGTITTAEQTLSEAEANSITDYSALFVRMVANQV